MKKEFNSVFAIVLLVLLASCNSTRKLIYLQDNAPDATYVDDKLVKSIPLQAPEYKVKPDDRLLIYVFSLTEDRMNFFKKPEMEVRVDSKGQIRLPVIGAVTIGDLTIKETEEKIKQVTAEYLKSPDITIKLLNFNVTVLGEVNKQGSYNIKETKINILGAIGEAGGLTENANMKNIRVIRNENDTARIYQFNLLEDNLLASNQFYLQPNDIVVINPMKSKTTSQKRNATIGLALSIATTLAFLFTKK
jgi:polysaccharide export outer membrane protein